MVVIASLFCASAGAVGLQGGPGRSGNDDIGLENNIPENGNASSSDTVEGNLGDTDGDGIIEDSGHGDGIIGDLEDMGSDVVSDIGDIGSDIENGDGVGIGNGMDSTNSNDSDRAPADSGMADNETGNGGAIVAVIIAIIIAIALIILIIAMIPRNKNKH